MNYLVASTGIHLDSSDFSPHINNSKYGCNKYCCAFTVVWVISPGWISRSGISGSEKK